MMFLGFCVQNEKKNCTRYTVKSRNRGGLLRKGIQASEIHLLVRTLANKPKARRTVSGTQMV